MSTTKSKSRGLKGLIIVIVLVGGAAAGFGYLRQTSDLRTDANATNPPTAAASNTPAAPGAVANPPPVDSRAKQREQQQEQDALQNAKPASPDNPIYYQRSDDNLVIGQANAPVTIVEYASLSCPHCAHFYTDVLPALKKEFIDSGKVKLVYRHFPLNEPALRAAQLVDCADKGQQEAFVKVLYTMQKNWAYTQDFLAQLKQIASVGGMDAARFDSCIADKKSEERILKTREEAAKVAAVNGTPAIYVNGVPVTGEASEEAVGAAIKNAKPKK